MLGNIFSSGEREVRLDVAATEDILNIFRTVPAGRVSNDAFSNIPYGTPFKVTMKTLPFQNNAELDILIERYWMRWQRDVRLWRKLFGVCPWFAERIPGTIHSIPVVPAFGTGYITTYVDKKHKQQFRWYWNNQHVSSKGTGIGLGNHRYDKKVNWALGKHLPTVDGRYTSEIATALPMYRTILILRESLEAVATQRANPTYFYEHHPSKTDNADQHFVARDSYGERAAGTMIEEMERMNTRKAHIRADNLRQSLMQAHQHNQQRRMQRLDDPRTLRFHSDGQGDDYARHNSGFADRAVSLPPDFKYVPAALPQVAADLNSFEQQFDRMLSSLMDFPYDLIMGGGSVRAAANVQGNIKYVNEQIKAEINEATRVTKDAFLIIYGQHLQDGLDAFARAHRRHYNTKDLLDLDIETEVVVEMQCTPIMSLADIYRFYEIGIMNKNDMAKHAFAQYALPPSQITVVSDEKSPLIKNAIAMKQQKGIGASVPPRKQKQVDITASPTGNGQ